MTWLLNSALYLGLRAWLLAWDLLTLPAWVAWYRPWARMLRARRVRARIVDKSEDSVTVEALPRSCPIRDEILNMRPAPPETLEQIWNLAVAKGGKRDILGTREVFGEEEEIQGDGRTFTKLIQGEYKWINYEDLDAKAADFARGLMDVGVEAKEKVAIYADSRAEWMVAAGAAFKSSVALVTLYTNLGEDDVIYALDQTKVKLVITSQELLPKLVKLLSKLSHVKNIVYFESRVPGKKINVESSSAKIVSFGKVCLIGENMRGKIELVKPTAHDLAILMYTSGSTGAPKGALLTHGQLTASMISCLVAAHDILRKERSEEEAYLAYLPMAHIFELTHELIVMLLGIRIGYSSPNTLTDAGTMVKRGQQGDATLLRPTVMIAVPLILERIYSGIRAKVAARGELFDAAFHVFVDYRLFWSKLGFDTPILNKVVFDKLRAALGGRIELLVGGGAPLSSEVHDFLRTCLRVTLVQGYGLTETAGGISLADGEDLTTGRVGHPLQGVRVRLENWAEGGYTVNDAAGPRGEMVVGCEWIAAGYFDMPEKTKEGFFEEDGIRWFRTGDIGQVMPDGTLSVVDRKKDLVKLQLGEYVSLGKVESVLRLLPVVESVCVCADPTKSSTVALLVPKADELKKIHSRVSNNNNCNGVGDGESKLEEELCRDAKTVAAVLQQIRDKCRSSGLNKYETPSSVTLLSEPWTPESGLVTAAMKLRRRQIQNRFQEEIDAMYSSK